MSAGTQLEQETVRRQAEILQVIFESLPMGVMVAGLEGRLLSNPAAQRILDPGTCVPITPEQTTVFGWYLSDQVTVVPPERFPLSRASHGEEFTDELFFVRRLDHPEGLWISMSGGPLTRGPHSGEQWTPSGTFSRQQILLPERRSCWNPGRSLYCSPTASPSPSLPEGRNLARGELWIT